ncbi:NepR family anti-sigma factor [Parvularcula marina]|nr:NepR family anti-sigma factor [Parvularcula marina]
MTDQKDTNPLEKRERRMRTNRIGRQLRQIYDDVIQEDVPDDFLKLLEDADNNRSSSGDA